MGFRIDLKGMKGKVMFNGIDVSNVVQKVQIIVEPGGMTHAVLTVAIEKLNGVDILPMSDDLGA